MAAVSASPERRENPRFACGVAGEIELDGGARVPARTQDISYSGICVVAQDPIAPGTAVQFHLRLVMEWAESDALSLPGQIVWSTRVRDGHQVGARFDPSRMTDAAWQQLDLFLRFLAGDLELPGAPEGDTAGE